MRLLSKSLILAVIFFLPFFSLTVSAERDVVVRSSAEAKQRILPANKIQPTKATGETSAKKAVPSNPDHQIKSGSETPATSEKPDKIIQTVKNTKNGKEVITFKPKTNRSNSNKKEFNSFFQGLTEKIFGFTKTNE